MRGHAESKSKIFFQANLPTEIPPYVKNGCIRFKIFNGKWVSKGLLIIIKQNYSDSLLLIWQSFKKYIVRNCSNFSNKVKRFFCSINKTFLQSEKHLEYSIKSSMQNVKSSSDVNNTQKLHHITTILEQGWQFEK